MADFPSSSSYREVMLVQHSILGFFLPIARDELSKIPGKEILEEETKEIKIFDGERSLSLAASK